MKAAKALIFRGVPKAYHFAIPDDFDLAEGDHVKLPFGPGTAGGLVLGFEESEIEGLKAIYEVDSKKPRLGPAVRDLIEWFQGMYQTTPFKAYQTVVGVKRGRVLKEDPPQAPPFSTPYPLSEDQQTVVDALTSPTAPSRSFIHGVTGSGKTELYIQLTHHTLSQGKQAIILVPEIALTPQLRDRFKERFGNIVSILHSGLTQKEKDIEWERMNQGHTSVVIGPRSAIFAPFESVGLIVIDEEHETSFKQDSHPRYKAHSVAAYRQNYHKALLVLGSATPDVSSMYFAHHCDDPEHKIAYFPIRNRIHNRPMPAVNLVDMKEEAELGRSATISYPLQQALIQALERKEQGIILINRRGYATYVICRSCKRVHTCPQCQLSFTYHQDRAYRCHRCDTIRPATPTCPSCKKPGLTFSGTGSQKIEVELQKLFPGKRIFRLDKDTGKTYKDVEAVLEGFKKEGDILVGTQMIAKGHDIPSVTVIGILGIDGALNIPDYRSSERTFQLLTQAAGRAGRGDKPGEVYIQTHYPHHPAIQSALTHDSMGYFEKEVGYREALYYPPFSTLTAIVFSSLNSADAQRACQTFATALISDFPQTMERHYMGPKKAPLEKIRDHYRWHLIIKSTAEDALALKPIISRYKAPKGVRFIIDFDPLSIL